MRDRESALGWAIPFDRDAGPKKWGRQPIGFLTAWRQAEYRSESSKTSKMRTRKLSANVPSPMGVRVLVADDDDRFRSLVATLLRQAAGVSSVLEAKDGAQAVQLGRDLRVHATSSTSTCRTSTASRRH